MTSFNLARYVISYWPFLIHPSMSIRTYAKKHKPNGVVSIPFMGCVEKGIDTSPQSRVVRDLKMRGPRRQVKRGLKGEFGVFQSSSRFFHLAHFVEGPRTLLELKS